MFFSVIFPSFCMSAYSAWHKKYYANQDANLYRHSNNVGKDIDRRYDNFPDRDPTVRKTTFFTFPIKSVLHEIVTTDAAQTILKHTTEIKKIFSPQEKERRSF